MPYLKIKVRWLVLSLALAANAYAQRVYPINECPPDWKLDRTDVQGKFTQSDPKAIKDNFIDLKVTLYLNPKLNKFSFSTYTEAMSVPHDDYFFWHKFETVGEHAPTDPKVASELIKSAIADPKFFFEKVTEHWTDHLCGYAPVNYTFMRFTIPYNGKDLEFKSGYLDPAE